MGEVVPCGFDSFWLYVTVKGLAELGMEEVQRSQERILEDPGSGNIKPLDSDDLETLRK